MQWFQNFGLNFWGSMRHVLLRAQSVTFSAKLESHKFLLIFQYYCWFFFGWKCSHDFYRYCVLQLFHVHLLYFSICNATVLLLFFKDQESIAVKYSNLLGASVKERVILNLCSIMCFYFLWFLFNICFSVSLSLSNFLLNEVENNFLCDFVAMVSMKLSVWFKVA